MSAAVIFSAGAVAELVGLALAARGFWRTWHQHADDRFLAPVAAAANRVRRQLAPFVRWLLGRRRPRTVQIGTAHDAIGIASSARVTKHYGPLPKFDQDPEEFARLVEQRTIELLEHVQAVDHRLTDEVAALRSQSKETAAKLAARIADVEGMSRAVAIGGLREQVLGWSLIVVGFCLQAVAQLM